jgi:uncharacterized protein YnzC (UPF0291/DUF896 family)
MDYSMEDVKNRLQDLNRKMSEGGLSEGEKQEFLILSRISNGDQSQQQAPMGVSVEELIGRINTLYQKSQNGTLSEGELEEQRILRNMYLDMMRQSMKGQLDQIEIVDEDKE